MSTLSKKPLILIGGSGHCKACIDVIEVETDYEIHGILDLPEKVAQHIQEAIRLFRSKNADSVASYCPEHHPVFWHKYVDENGQISEVFGLGNIQNPQEIKPTYFLNGPIYIFKTELLRQVIYYTENSFAYFMNPEISVDIDTQTDFDYLAYLLAKKIF